MKESFDKLVKIIASILPVCKGISGNTIMFGPLDSIILSHLIKELTENGVDVIELDNKYKFTYMNNYFVIW